MSTTGCRQLMPHGSIPRRPISRRCYRPIDNSFSWVTSRESYEALFRSSQSVGIGISAVVQGSGLRVRQVFLERCWGGRPVAR